MGREGYPLGGLPEELSRVHGQWTVLQGDHSVSRSRPPQGKKESHMPVEQQNVQIPAFQQAVMAARVAKDLAEVLGKSKARLENVLGIAKADEAGISLEEAVARNQAAKNALAAQIDEESAAIIALAKLKAKAVKAIKAEASGVAG